MRLDAARTRTTAKGSAQPRPTTVSTSWPWSSGARSTGRCSSRRTRTGQERVACEVERGDGLVSPHGRELPEELVERVAALKVVEEGLDRHPGADEDRSATQDVGVAVQDLAEWCHADRSLAWPEYTRGTGRVPNPPMHLTGRCPARR